jgi:hypothetical protein
MLGAKHGARNAMTIEDAVRNIMVRSKGGQSVDEVCQKIGDELEGEIRTILNRMGNEGDLEPVRGCGDHPTYYYPKKPIKFKQRL